MQILLLGFLSGLHVLNIEIKIKDLFRFFYPDKNISTEKFYLFNNLKERGTY
jgi:hypothetical protein